MQTRKSGILALVLGLAVLGGAACESKTDVQVPPTPVVVTLNIAPDPVPALTVGQTVQLVAVVTGSSNQSATWTSSNTTVATVDGTGKVEAKAAGVAVISAVSAADANARDAVTIQVTSGGGPVTGTPTISIASVTNFATNVPVNPGNVAGVVDVTMNVDIPAGVSASAVRVTLNGTEVCRQTFATGGSAEVSAAVPVTITCSINTAAVNATTGAPLFPNGSYSGNNSIRAEVLSPTNTVLASATFQPIVLNNVDVINAVLTTSKAPVTGPGGLSWRGGDVTVTLTPTIFSGSANNLSSVTVTLSNSAQAAMEGTVPAGCGSTRTTTNGVPPTATCTVVTNVRTASTATNGAFSVTFPNSGAFGAASQTAGVVGQIEDPNVMVTISGVTTGGNNFASNYVVRLGAANGNIIADRTGGVNNTQVQVPLRLDNLAPRVTNFAMLANQYVNGAFTFGATTGAGCTAGAATAAPCFTTVSYGSNSQTTQFNVLTTGGAAVNGGANVQNASTVDESTTSTSYIAQAVTTDLLGNSRTVYATAPGAAPSTTQAGAVRFGVDRTPPTVSFDAGQPADNSTNSGLAYNTSFNDAGVGPSGFPANPTQIKVEAITAAGTTCYNPDGTAQAAGTCTFVNDSDGDFVLPAGVDAYFRVTVRSVDIAGNTSAEISRVQLRDFTAPVAGAIATPSSIAGGSSVTFTAPLTDNVELGDVLPAIGYEENAVNVYLASPRQQIGTYGFDTFSNTNPGNFTVNPFIRSIETTAANVPSGTISRASEVQMATRDVAGVQLSDACPAAGAADDATTQNCRLRTANILAATAFGIGGTGVETSWAAGNRPFAPVSGTNPNGGGTGFSQSGAATSVCSNNPVGANAGCNVVTATSVTLTATATGPAQTFANPFSNLQFYAIDPVTGRSFSVCTASVSVSDNTQNATRTWTYTCSWNPGTQSTIPNAAGVYNVFALGTDSSGRGLMSNLRTVTVTSD